MKLLIPLLAGAVLLAGCEQDPLKNASDSVRNGHLPDSGKIEPQKPLPADSLQIDAPAKYNGRVNFPIEIKITGRVLVPDVPYTLMIANLDKFPGAVFDATTGVFKWTPTKDFVNGQIAVMETLEVVMKTLPGAKKYPESTETKIIPVIVANSYDRPVINSVTIDRAAMKATTRVPFVMEDQDAVNERDLNVLISECAIPNNDYSTPSPSLGTLVQVDKKTLKAGSKAGEYKGEIVIDLSATDFIQDGYYCMAIQAVSKFGVASIPYEKSFTVQAAPRQPSISLPSEFTVNIGEKNRLSFSVYDPTGFGRASLASTPDLNKVLTGSSIKCETSYGASVTCMMTIDTTTAVAGRYPVTFDMTTTRNGLVATKSTTFNIVVK